MNCLMSTRAAWLLVLCSPAIAGAIVACSGSDTASSSGGSNTNGATSCTDESLDVSFKPMYSSYDGTHTFQVPAIVDGVSATKVKWGISDPDIADLAKDTTTGGVMISIKKAGTATIVASAGDLCGSSKLTVTEATTDAWENGNQRYNNGVTIGLPGSHDGGGGGGGGGGGDGGGRGQPNKELACTNCHGPTANSAFKDVAHTPQQTGGFSDDDLEKIFREGTVPKDGYFDTDIVSYDQWQRFHKWDMSDEEAKGIIVYLRSLTPEAQEGAANFGGRFRDGGRPPPRDGGYGPPKE